MDDLERILHDGFTRAERPDDVGRQLDALPGLTARDVELARDRLWTRLPLREPLSELRPRLRREEGL
jgi:hypothetical protein